jgi:hypothetical protein
VPDGRPSASSSVSRACYGRLGDGQHRCRAVIEAGRPIVVSMALIADRPTPAAGPCEQGEKGLVGARAQRKSERAMTMRCTSDGPSPIRRTRASRYHRSSGNSFDTP